MSEAGSVLGVTLHLLAADLAAMGPLVALWFAWRAARGDRLAADVERGLLRASIWALIAASALGAAALGLLWLLNREAWFEAARQLPARRYWFGLVELAFSWACLGAALWLARRRTAAGFDGRFSARFILTALAGTNLAYHFPPLFSAIGVLSTRPNARGGELRFLPLISDPEVLARTLHHLLAALAVTGAAIMLGALRWRTAEEADERRRAAGWGARIALAAVAGQLLAGLHLLFQLPAESRERLMGGDALTGLLFAAALVVTVMLLHRLAAIGFGDAQPKAIVTAALLIAMAMLLMTATRHRTRNAASASGGKVAFLVRGSNAET
ncbi:MAG TPA: hypothetical protein VMV10_31500 [Pirellulales bacterium]|nr:hypothetical protein [Pirellulales bacterium]